MTYSATRLEKKIEAAKRQPFPFRRDDVAGDRFAMHEYVPNSPPPRNSSHQISWKNICAIGSTPTTKFRPSGTCSLVHIRLQYPQAHRRLDPGRISADYGAPKIASTVPGRRVPNLSLFWTTVSETLEVAKTRAEKRTQWWTYGIETAQSM